MHTHTHAHAHTHTHTRTHTHTHTHTTPPPHSPQAADTRQYIHGNTESVPLEIHGILLGEAVIAGGPASSSAFRRRPDALGFGLGRRGVSSRAPLPRGCRGGGSGRVEVVVEAAEALVHALVVALVGGGVHLVLSGRDLQLAVPHAVAKVDDHTLRAE